MCRRAACSVQKSNSRSPLRVNQGVDLHRYGKAEVEHHRRAGPVAKGLPPLGDGGPALGAAPRILAGMGERGAA